MTIWKKRKVGGFPPRKTLGTPDDVSRTTVDDALSGYGDVRGIVSDINMDETVSGGHQQDYETGAFVDPNIDRAADAVDAALSDDFPADTRITDLPIGQVIKGIHSVNPPTTIDAKYQKKNSNYKPGTPVMGPHSPGEPGYIDEEEALG